MVTVHITHLKSLQPAILTIHSVPSTMTSITPEMSSLCNIMLECLNSNSVNDSLESAKCSSEMSLLDNLHCMFTGKLDSFKKLELFNCCKPLRLNIDFRKLEGSLQNEVHKNRVISKGVKSGGKILTCTHYSCLVSELTLRVFINS